MTFNQVLKRLKSKSNPAAVRGMARFGITAAKAYGWSAPALKKFAREIGKDHEKALNWALRQIGKRNRALNRAAVKAAQEIHDFELAQRPLDCLGCAAGAAQPGGAKKIEARTPSHSRESGNPLRKLSVADHKRTGFPLSRE